MSGYPDEQLVTDALADSHLAFGQLVKQYQYRVLRTITPIIRDEQGAQDVAQETFLSAWSNLAKLKEREKFGRWLNQIAINLSKNWLRDQGKNRENKVPLDEDMVVLTQELRFPVLIGIPRSQFVEHTDFSIRSVFGEIDKVEKRL